MAFMVDPNATDEGGGSAPRPDVRAGRKVLACAGIEKSQTRNGDTMWNTTWVVVHDPDGGQDVGALVWDKLTVSDRAAWRLRLLAQAVGQSSSWDAENRDAMAKVLARRPIMAEIRLEASRTRTNDDGTPRMEGEVGRIFPWRGELTQEEGKVLADTRKWWKSWAASRSQGGGGGGQSRPRNSNPDPTSWDGGGGGGGGYSHDDIPF